MPRPIGEQVLVVTGASSGIGLATAQEAGRRGAAVVLAARGAAALRAAAAEVRARGGRALAVPTDVTDPAQVDALAAAALAEFGRIDTWVNAAAVSAYGTFEQIALEDWRRIVDTILMGSVHGARAALPALRRSAGALVCVGSVAADRGMPLMSAYSAAKHALKGWLEALRVELEHEGAPVRVTLVNPASIDTPFFQHARTYLGVEPRPMPPVYAPELAVKEIVRAAETDVRNSFVGGAARGMNLGQRLAPRALDLALRRTAFAGQRTDRPKPADAPSNLFAPLTERPRVHGRYTDEAMTVCPYQSAAAHPALSRAILLTGLALGLGVAGARLMRRG